MVAVTLDVPPLLVGTRACGICIGGGCGSTTLFAVYCGDVYVYCGSVTSVFRLNSVSEELRWRLASFKLSSRSSAMIAATSMSGKE